MKQSVLVSVKCV